MLQEDEDESNDQESDADQTGNAANGNNNLFTFLQCSPKLHCPN